MIRFISIAILFSLFLVSCENADQQVNKGEKSSEVEAPSKLATLSNIIDSTTAKKHINFFKNASLKDLASSFYFDRIFKEHKVMSSKLDPAQLSLLLERFTRLKVDDVKEVSLRIHMALLSAEVQSEVIADKPNLVLLLELVVDQKSSNTYYPLSPSTSSFLTDFEQSYGSQDTSSDCPLGIPCGAEQYPIGQKCVNELVGNWGKVRVTEVAEQLYLGQNTSDPKDRIQYYTFNVDDTNKVFGYIESDHESLFKVHFGQLKGGPDCVPLRTIMHIDSSDPENVNETVDRAMEDAAHFEFAKPCPPACDTSKLIQLI